MFQMLMAGTSLAGLGLTIFGGMKATAGAEMANQAQQQIIGLEQQVEAQRRQAMELDAARKSKEVIRNAQRSRSVALANATNQGGQFGSGLQGGYGEISGKSGVNLLGIQQNKEIGENVFNLNAQISQQKIAMAQGQSQMIEGQALSGFGKDISGSLPAFSNLYGTLSGLNFGSTGGTST